jgi:hypothetical protein
MENNILQSLMSHDNAIRKRAEETLMSQRDTDPAGLLNLLLQGMQQVDDQGIAQLAALMYKKLFLDDARSENLSAGELEMMKGSIMSTIDFSQNMTLLKRKGDIISKIFTKLKQSEEFLKLLVSWSSCEIPQGRRFAMYLFEIVSDCHLSQD